MAADLKKLYCFSFLPHFSAVPFFLAFTWDHILGDDPVRAGRGTKDLPSDTEHKISLDLGRSQTDPPTITTAGAL